MNRSASAIAAALIAASFSFSPSSFGKDEANKRYAPLILIRPAMTLGSANLIALGGTNSFWSGDLRELFDEVLR